MYKPRLNAKNGTMDIGRRVEATGEDLEDSSKPPCRCSEVFIILLMPTRHLIWWRSHAVLNASHFTGFVGRRTIKAGMEGAKSNEVRIHY